MVCSPGQKPKVKYRFGNGQERVFKSPYSPIEIITKTTPVKATTNYSNPGFLVKAYSTNNYGNVGYYVHDYRVEEYPNSAFQFRYGLHVIRCGEFQFRSTVNIDPSTLTVDYNQKCPVPSVNKYSIEVRYNGLIIFTDQGNSPVSFNVQCGNCKEDEIECIASHPPGYCCIPCKTTAEKIQNLANKIR